MTGRSKQILIVEDESIVALDLSRRLKKMGYGVIGTVAHGDKALSKAEASKPDLILMDIRIKGNLDGIEVAERIKQTLAVPIIFLTAYAEDKTLERAKSTKPYGYLLKPYSEKDLHVTIQIALERFEHDTEIQEREQHLRLALDVTQAGTWEKPSPAAPLLFGYIPNGQLSSFNDWQAIQAGMSESQNQSVEKELEKLNQSACEITLEFEADMDNSGVSRWFCINGKSFYDTEGQCLKSIGVIQDITQRKIIESRLKQAALVYDHSAEGILVLNSEKRVISINSAFKQMTGFDEDDMLHKELPILERKNVSDKMYDVLWEAAATESSWHGQLRVYCKDGRLRYVWANVALVADSNDRLGKYVVVLSDITEVHDAQEKLAHIAYHDNLTDLPNRSLLKDRLRQSLAKAKRLNQQLAVLFIDLDHFKRVNDTLGHQVGDSMLVTIAQRLKNGIRATDILARIGGDEFIVVLDDVDSKETVAHVCRKLLETISEPLTLANNELIPSGSIGVSMYPLDDIDPDGLIKKADMAMYTAKTNGRNNLCFYRSEMSDYTTKYFSREQELKRALKNNEFRLLYQPQYSAETGGCIGCEALIRWQNPESGLLGANEIIPYAEMSSLIIDVGNWVFESVFKQINDWQAEGYEVPKVSINVSSAQFESRNFVETLFALLDKYNIDERKIELEITESCIQDNETIVSTLRQIARRGIPIAIDDFGTGYSCMASLKYLPLNRIKIDRQFIRETPGDENDCSIVKAIIALAKQLKLEVIAEGVETEAHKKFLMQAKCDYLQGYLLSYPLSPEEYVERIMQVNLSA